jgi:peptidyl-prolyl cis-trans isomerase D
MATLQNLRNKAGVFLAIVIFIALASFILGDLFQSGNSIFQGKQMEIARIDGESVDYLEFQSKFDEISDIYKSNNQTNSLDEKAYEQILNQTWENIVQERIMGKVYDELGIDITPEEMFDMVQGNNLHPIIQQIFGDPQTRRVDKTNIIQFLKYIQENPESQQKESWLSVEKQIVTSKRLSKYSDLVGKSLTANSLQAKQNLAEKNVVADLKFIQKKFISVPDSSIKVSDAELKKYYKENQKEFEQKSQKTLSYIVINITASEDDDRDAFDYVNNLKEEFSQATENPQFVNANSDQRFEDIFYTQNQLTPAIAEWAFNAAENDMYGPIKEGNDYKLFKLNAIKMLPDSVRASHILIRVESGEQLQYANYMIDSLKTAIETGNTTFEAAAIAFSQDGSASQGGDLGWFIRGAMVPEFDKAAFMSERNELVKVQTQFGIHLVKVILQGNKTKNVQLAVVEREVSPSTATHQKLYSEASQFAAKAQDLEGFNKTVSEMSLSKRSITVNENDRNINELGAVRNLIRSAFTNGKKGELVVGQDRSPVFETEDKFIIAAIESEFEHGVRPFESVKAAVELAVINEKKKQMLYDQFKNASGSSIEHTASALSLELGEASGFRLAFGSVNAIGYEPAINGAVTALGVNQQSKPIIGRSGVYIIELTNKMGDTTGDLNEEKKAIYTNSSYRASYQAYETLKKTAEIRDKRYKFY